MLAKNSHGGGMKGFLPSFHIFFISVEPPNPAGKMLHRLHSLEVRTRPKCLGRSWNPPTERPERQLYPWTAIFRFEYFWRSNQDKIISHLWFLSDAGLYPPL
ncbi:hypothetical protein ACROYT_G016074 [Oculina patagonica]